MGEEEEEDHGAGAHGAGSGREKEAEEGEEEEEEDEAALPEEWDGIDLSGSKLHDVVWCGLPPACPRAQYKRVLEYLSRCYGIF